MRDEHFIVECYLVSGGFDFVLKVAARDVDHYREIMDDTLAAEIGIERFLSFIALQQIKQSRGIPLSLIGVSSGRARSTSTNYQAWIRETSTARTDEVPVWTRRTNPCVAASNRIKHMAKTPSEYLDRMRVVVRIVCRGAPR